MFRKLIEINLMLWFLNICIKIRIDKELVNGIIL